MVAVAGVCLGESDAWSCVFHIWEEIFHSSRKPMRPLQTTIRWQINDNMYLKIGGLQQTS